MLVQFIYREQSFNSPFLLTYIGTSLFTILLPIHYIQHHILSKLCSCCCSSSSSSSSSSANVNLRQQYQMIESPLPSRHDDDDNNDGSDHNDGEDGDDDNDAYEDESMPQHSFKDVGERIINASNGMTLDDHYDHGESGMNSTTPHHRRHHHQQQRQESDNISMKELGSNTSGRRLEGRDRGGDRYHHHDSDNFDHNDDDDNDDDDRQQQQVSNEQGFEQEIQENAWTLHDHFRASSKIASIWFISNYAYNASLLYTSVTSSTVLASTGSLFTFLFAAGIFNVESFNYIKLTGVVLGMIGSILTGLHDAASVANSSSASLSSSDNVWDNNINGTTEFSIFDDTTATTSENNDDTDGDGGDSRRFLQSLVLRTLESLSDAAGNDKNRSDEFTAGNNSTGDYEMEFRVWGDCLGLLSAVGYGLYAAMVRVLCPQDESLMSMELFLGFVGLCNAIVLSPIAIYEIIKSFQFEEDGNDTINLTPNKTSSLSIEYDNEGNFEGMMTSSESSSHLTWFVLGLLVVKGLLDNVLSDYLWARAVILTSATVATVGLGLTIPLAFLSDIVLMHKSDVLDTSSICGAASVLFGFILVNIGETSVDTATTPTAGAVITTDNNIIPYSDNVDIAGAHEVSGISHGEQELPTE